MNRAIVCVNVLLPVSVLLASCTRSDTCEVPLTQLGLELKQSVLSQFQQQGIEHQIREDGTICVLHTDIQRASQVLGSSVGTTIPRETSRSMEPEVHRRVVARLGKHKITFSEQMLDGHTFLAWAKSDDVEINRIIDEEFQKYLEEQLETGRK